MITFFMEEDISINPKKNMASGSGVIISDDENILLPIVMLLTTFQKEIEVVLNDKKTYTAANIR